MKKNILLTVLFVFVFSGCSFKEYKLFQEEENKGKTTTIVEQEEYDKEVIFENILAPNDRVDITVYIQAGKGSQQMTSILTSRETNTSNPIEENIGLLVTQEGTVRLPLIGSFQVSGFTQDEASKMLNI